VEQRGQAVYALARYDDGRPSQRRPDTVIEGIERAYIQGSTPEEQLLSAAQIGSTHKPGIVQLQIDSGNRSLEGR
jgi:hypothetical protein